MRVILTAAERAQEKRRDKHFDKSMATLRKARTGAELLKLIESIHPLKGNVIESSTIRRLPKGYMIQYHWLIASLDTLGWSIEEMRQLIQKISARRITHQLVLTYVNNLSAEDKAQDVKSIIALNRMDAWKSTKDAIRIEQIEKGEKAAKEILIADLPSTHPLMPQSIWDDFPNFETQKKLTIRINNKGGLALKFADLYNVSHTIGIKEHLIKEVAPKLSRDPDGEKLLEVLRSEEEISKSFKLTDAAVYLLFIATRYAIVSARRCGSYALDDYFKEVHKIPFSVMKWLLLRSLNDSNGISVSTLSTAPAI